MYCNGGGKITEFLIYFLNKMAILPLGLSSLSFFFMYEVLWAVSFYKTLQMSFISQFQLNILFFQTVKEFISLVANPFSKPK